MKKNKVLASKLEDMDFCEKDPLEKVGPNALLCDVDICENDPLAIDFLMLPSNKRSENLL